MMRSSARITAESVELLKLHAGALKSTSRVEQTAILSLNMLALRLEQLMVSFGCCDTLVPAAMARATFTR